MTDKIKILFVNDEMRMGGVARVLNTLMAALPKDRYEIDLLILHKEGMLLEEIPEQRFSITDFYVDNAARLKLRSVISNPREWVDAGKPETLPVAAAVIESRYL